MSATNEPTTDVVVVGSGFGGAVAALRFAELGEQVTVLERGARVEREQFRTDLDFFWIPGRDAFGMNDISRRGRHVLAWVGAAVGGGSHVYAGTLKRTDAFTGYPAMITAAEMSPWFARAEAIMKPVVYPSYAPYGDNGTLLELRSAARRLALREPHVVADRGLCPLAISFMPEGGDLDAEFTNEHGATQRYHHPHEQSILGGDIGAKNTLDKNYLHLAEQRGATIRPLTEVTGIEPLGAEYRVHYRTWLREPTATRRWVRRWVPGRQREAFEVGTLRAKRVVLAAGAIGSTELLMRARDRDRTLPDLSPALGTRYTTNGDSVSLFVPTRGVGLGWLLFAVLVAGLALHLWWLAAIGGAGYLLRVAAMGELAADLGTTNSDYVRFAPEPGISDAMYIEGGRYPTPGRLLLAVTLGWLGLYHPRRYRRIVRVTRWLLYIVPPLALLARMWPVPLLKMGRDRATGRFVLDDNGRASIDFDIAANRDYYTHLDRLGKKLASAAGGLWLPNLLHRLTGVLEVPHNQGGAPMGESATAGVVDHAGRVFGYDNLLVLDGSIIPVSPGPNPALTILALAERAMNIVTAQIREHGVVSARSPRTEGQDAAVA